MLSNLRPNNAAPLDSAQSWPWSARHSPLAAEWAAAGCPQCCPPNRPQRWLRCWLSRVLRCVAPWWWHSVFAEHSSSARRGSRDSRAPLRRDARPAGYVRRCRRPGMWLPQPLRAVHRLVGASQWKRSSEPTFRAPQWCDDYRAPALIEWYEFTL